LLNIDNKISPLQYGVT